MPRETLRHALTVEYTGIASEIRSPVGVSLAYDPRSGLPEPAISDYQAVWDTGATCTVVSQKLIADLNLQPIGTTPNYTVGETRTAWVYLVNIYLPSNVRFPGLRVIDSDLTQSDDDRYDVLIGMDVIGRGDFSITNFEGKTCMSFETPSYRKTDFVKQINSSRKQKVKPARKRG